MRMPGQFAPDFKRTISRHEKAHSPRVSERGRPGLDRRSGQPPMLDGGHADGLPGYSGPVYQSPGPQGPSLPAPSFQGPMPSPATQNGSVSYGAGYNPGYNPAYPPAMPGVASMNAFVG